LLVIGCYFEPVIGVVLLDTIVACYSPALVMNIFCVGRQLGNLCVLCTRHLFGLFCYVGGRCEDLRRHMRIAKVLKKRMADWERVGFHTTAARWHLYAAGGASVNGTMFIFRRHDYV
jgi:hypothetical protein